MAALEGAVQDGKILAYGVEANALSYASSHPQHISVDKLVRAATQVSDAHSFGAVRCDANLLRPDLFATLNSKNNSLSAAQHARELGLGVFTTQFFDGRAKDGAFMRLKSFPVPFPRNMVISTRMVKEMSC